MKTRKWKKIGIIFLVISSLVIGFILFRPGVPPVPEHIATITELEKYIGEITTFGSPPGMSLIVVKNDRILYENGFGWADPPKKIPATLQTVYHWWSCTKIATAIAIFQLRDAGKLQLDDSVVQYLPFFNVKYPSGSRSVVTIRNLLNHSSGLPEPGFRIISWIHHDGEPSLNQTELLKKILPEYSELLFTPGDHSEYTNIGYMVLGAIIEKVTGQPYEAYITEHLLGPLEMNHTGFLYTNSMKSDEACGSHPLIDKYTPLVPFVAGSYIREISGSRLFFKRIYNDQTPPTGLIGPAADAAHLVIAYLNKGTFNGKQILSEKSILAMTHDGYCKRKEDNPHTFQRQGFGWQVYKRRGRMFIQHEGGGLGFRTILRIYPDDRLGFILFNNDVTCEGGKILDLAETLKWE